MDKLMNNNTIGLNIKHLRKKKKFSQSELSNMIGGKSHQMIGRYETGESLPPLDVIYSLAKVLEVDPGDLISKDLRKGSSKASRVEEEEIDYKRIDPILEALKAAQKKYNHLVDDIIKTNKPLAKELGLL
jgi:transcriptional regulator with XRE-family HTH domain